MKVTHELFMENVVAWSWIADMDGVSAVMAEFMKASAATFRPTCFMHTRHRLPA